MPVHVILGPMFSGKSQRLQDIAHRYSSIGRRVLLITHPYARSEYPNTTPVTHVYAAWLTEVEMETIDNYDIIMIDEAQFYEGLIEFVTWAAETKDKIVYVSGLDGDYRRKRFGDILNCIPLCDTVERLTAFCTKCANGTPGLFTSRKDTTITAKIMPGGEDAYTTLCRRCYLSHLETQGSK
jgi:thymidine kinase